MNSIKIDVPADLLGQVVSRLHGLPIIIDLSGGQTEQPPAADPGGPCRCGATNIVNGEKVRCSRPARHSKRHSWIGVDHD